jgi:hypothetical protein
MSTLVTRAGKGSPLTHNEVDANFNNLNTDKIQSGNTVAALTITALTTPSVQAVNSAGLALKNSAGTTQMSMGAGGGDNVTVSAPIAITPANGLVNIAPTGTGSLTINPATAGTMNNMAIGGTTAAAGSFTDLSVTGITSFDGSQGTAGQVLTSAGTGATPTWQTPSTSSGTVTSVAATVPSLLSISGSPITTSGTLAITYSGTALPVANGGTGATARQDAMDALAGAVTSGQYLRGNGTDVVMSAIQAADVPTLNQNTTGTASNVTGTVAVANGGTGSTTLTANNVLLGNGTSALQAVAPSTNGNVLTSNGTTWVSSAPSGGGNTQFSLALRGSATNSSGTPLVFNSTGSLTWTCPAGVTRIKLIVVGGGGGGAGGGGSKGVNGGSGGVGVGFYTVTPTTAYSITIGAGGAGGNGGSAGGAGGSSSFGSLLTATNGSGGSGGSRTNGTGALGNIINNNTQFFSPLELSRVPTVASPNPSFTGNFFPNLQNGGSQSAQTYTISFNYSAGAGGEGGAASGCCINDRGGAGVSGAVYIEYVGS